MDVKPSKDISYINTISASTLGVYLIHDNRVVRNMIWEHAYEFSTLPSSFWLWPVLLLVCCSIYTVTISIDIVVEKLIKYIKPEDFLIERLYNKIKDRFDGITK